MLWASTLLITLPFTLISPLHGWINRNSATSNVLLPLPVRPTTPTLAACFNLNDTLSRASGSAGLYCRQTSLNSTSPLRGHDASSSTSPACSRGMSLMYLTKVLQTLHADAPVSGKCLCMRSTEPIA